MVSRVKTEAICVSLITQAFFKMLGNTFASVDGRSKTFPPNCLKCSPHIQHTVAIFQRSNLHENYHVTWKGTISKGNFIFQPLIVRGYVTFRGGGVPFWNQHSCYSWPKAANFATTQPSSWRIRSSIQSYRNKHVYASWTFTFTIGVSQNYILRTQVTHILEDQFLQNLGRSLGSSYIFCNVIFVISIWGIFHVFHVFQG